MRVCVCVSLCENHMHGTSTKVWVKRFHSAEFDLCKCLHQHQHWIGRWLKKPPQVHHNKIPETINLALTGLFLPQTARSSRPLVRRPLIPSVRWQTRGGNHAHVSRVTVNDTHPDMRVAVQATGNGMNCVLSSNKISDLMNSHSCHSSSNLQKTMSWLWASTRKWEWCSGWLTRNRLFVLCVTLTFKYYNFGCLVGHRLFKRCQGKLKLNITLGHIDFQAWTNKCAAETLEMQHY